MEAWFLWANLHTKYKSAKSLEEFTSKIKARKCDFCHVGYPKHMYKTQVLFKRNSILCSYLAHILASALKNFSRKNFSYFSLKKTARKNFLIFSPKSPHNFQETDFSYISRKVYLEPQHIQNHGVFKTRGIFRTLSLLPNGHSGLNPKNFSPKNFLYIFLKIPALKKFLIFSQKNAFLIFLEMDFGLSGLSPQNVSLKKLL